jgi:hypothetical protein
MVFNVATKSKFEQKITSSQRGEQIMSMGDYLRFEEKN